MEDYHKIKYAKKCEICGKLFDAWNNRQKFCSDDCRYKHKLQQGAVFREVYKSQEQKQKSRKKKKPTLTEISAAARQAGMTYGQYVAKMGL